jgi:fimbrial chaperone protein
LTGFRTPWLALACLASLLASVSAEAASFSVIPVRIYFAPRERAIAVTLANPGDAPVALQAELYDWQQSAEGNDQLQPTDDLVLAPTIVRLAAHSQQVVRLALLRPADPQRQLTYRMIVREVPELSGVPQEGVAVPVALALSLPVFVTPPGARAQLDCAPRREAQQLLLTCVNKGTAVALLRSARLERGAAALGSYTGAAYLLPGASRSLPLAVVSAADLAPGPARVVLGLDDDTSTALEVDLPR